MILLDAAAVRRELALRGVTQVELAEHAHIGASTLAGALHGKAVTATTFKRIVTGLASLPRLGSEQSGIDEAAVKRLVAGTNGRHRARSPKLAPAVSEPAA